ncbi:MAG: iron-containing alcohol dehydrogenase [Planctomycetes bacterium]|nr:iron-containing alcohol dehydrogenase [Planctomycetota bacterium]
MISFPEFFDFCLPTRVVAQVGAVSNVGTEARALGITRAFLLTDAVLVKLGIAEQVLAPLREAGVEIAGVFDSIPPNSETKVVERAAEAARAGGADGLVACGGGSVMDTAKAVGIVLSRGGSILDHQGINVIDRPVTPLICLPTTAGTGSEISRFAVVKDDASHQKISFVSDHLCPRLAILDAALTTSMPPALTAATGMDACTHAVEAYCSQGAGPFTDALGMAALPAIVETLPKAVADGADVAFRAKMLIASAMAGAAMSLAGVGCVHAMAHACGGRRNVPHGVANSILLPHGLGFNAEAIPEKASVLAAKFGIAECEKMSAGARAERLVAAVRDLSGACRVPQRLRDVGVVTGDLDAIAEDALADGAMFFNPRPAEAADLRKLLEAAF